MSMIRRWDLVSRLALGALALASAAGVSAGVEAWRLRPSPVASISDAIELRMASPLHRGDPASESLVLAAVTKDPFRPDRKRPASRYKLPEERAAAAARARRTPPALGRMRLLGTAALPGGGGLAALEMPGRPAWVVRVGEAVEGLQLISVERGLATFAGPDTTFTLSLPNAAGKRRTR